MDRYAPQTWSLQALVDAAIAGIQFALGDQADIRVAHAMSYDRTHQREFKTIYVNGDGVVKLYPASVLHPQSVYRVNEDRFHSVTDLHSLTNQVAITLRSDTDDKQFEARKRRWTFNPSQIGREQSVDSIARNAIRQLAKDVYHKNDPDAAETREYALTLARALNVIADTAE
jgi:hypothetical protein